MKIGFLLANFILSYSVSLQEGTKNRNQRKIVNFDVLDENLDLEEEDKKEKAFNYTKTAFSPNKPIPVKTPTTFAFDVRSQLKSHLPPGVSINPGLDKFKLPTEFDFHIFDSQDILAPLYEHEIDLERRRLGGLAFKDPMFVDKSHLKLMLRNSLTLPRHNQRNSSLADSVGQYIMRKLGRLGLLTGTQVFSPSQFREKFWDPGEEIPQGLNIIGIYPGAKFNTSEDKLIVVGAHWDTTGFTDGFNDNGSGVAAVLETARALAQSDCLLQFSVIFVAFDLEEVGAQGSQEFVRSYLIPRFFLTDHPPEFQGAFILDTILNFNDTEKSQNFPRSWSDNIVGDALKETLRDRFRGNFISLISRDNPESELVKLLRKKWDALQRDRQFRESANIDPRRFKLRNMAITLTDKLPSFENLTNYVNFLRSDHIRFWFVNEFEYQFSLKSVLFTDTGPERGVMGGCYHRECDSARVGETLNNETNFDFLATTVQTLIDSVVELSGARCPLSDRQNIKNDVENKLIILNERAKAERKELETLTFQRYKYNAKYLRESTADEIYV